MKRFTETGKSKRRKRPTIQEVAELAQVSTATVSRVLNTPVLHDDKTRQRVEAAVEQLGYVPNHLGVSLRRLSTKVLLVVVPGFDLQNTFFADVIRWIQVEAESRGYAVFIADTAHTTQAERRVLARSLLPAPAPTSQYLREEGKASVDTDCFSCSSAHLATFAGALDRAAQAAQQAGHCDADCQQWLALAVQEPGILLEHDWPATKQWPPDQQAVVDRYRPQVEALLHQVLDPARQDVLLAAAGLKEATRFTRAGDPIDHPEVEARRLQAEERLTLAERRNLGAWDDATATAIRRLRQQVSNGITDPEALKQVAQQADQVAQQAVAPWLAQQDPQRLRTLADQARALHQAYAADRRRFAATPAPAAPVFHRVAKVYEDVDTRIPEELAHSFLADGPDTDLPALVGATPETEQAIHNLLRLEAARQVPVRIAPLPPVVAGGTVQGQILGAYDPQDDLVLLGPQVWGEDPEHVATVAEETAHSLLHNRRCDIYPPPCPDTPYLEIPEEREAKAATLLALVAAGIPFETTSGRRIDPQRVRAAAAQALAQMDPLMRSRAVWAADILTRAIQGDITGAAAAAQACPRTLAEAPAVPAAGGPTP